MRDRITAVRLGKEKAQTELDQVQAEIAAERRKFDVFLDKDRDKLRYAKEVLQTRQLVMRSFEKEAMRVKTKGKKSNADLVDDEKYKAGREELRRIQTMRERPVAPPKQTVRRVKTKSMEKPEPQLPSYKNVRSRLMKSIESTRNKETKKYVNPNKRRDVALQPPKKSNKENTSNGTRGMSATSNANQILESFHKTRSIISKGTQFLDNDGEGNSSRRTRPFFQNEKIATTAGNVMFPPQIIAADANQRKTVFRQSQPITGSKE